MNRRRARRSPWRVAAAAALVATVAVAGCTSRPKLIAFGGCLYGGGTTEPHDGYEIEVSDVWTTVGFTAKSGRRGPLVMIGDSLTAWSMNETMAALIQRGFGPICVDAVPGRQVRRSGDHVPSGVSGIDHVRTSDRRWAGAQVSWVVSLGTNDLFHTASDPAVMAADIEAALSAIGPVNRPINWVNVRTGLDRRTDENTWNQLLDDQESVTVVDWAAHVATLDRTPFVDDKIHIRPGALADRANFVAQGLGSPNSTT